MSDFIQVTHGKSKGKAVATKASAMDWAAESDDEHEVVQPEPITESVPVVEESDSSSDEEDDDESDRIVVSIPVSKVTVDKVKSKSVPKSKKELKKELQQQKESELEDLDKLLGELGVSTTPVTETPAVVAPVEADVAKAPSDKKKKKKKTTSKTEVQASTEEAPVDETPVVVDPKEILLQKAKAMKKKTNSSVASQIALDEAKKASGDDKKKKKDKSKFSEYSF